MSSPRPARAAVVVLALVAFGLAAVAPASAAPATSATDGFSRTVSNGLGTADTGGAWTLEGSASRFAVGSGTARLTMTAAAQLSGYLSGTALRDTDVVDTVGVAALPRGGSFYLGLLARHTGTSDYSTEAVVSASGAVQLTLLAGSTGIAAAPLPGLTVAAGSGLRVRLQVTGSNPTTVRARAWKAGTAEPASWQVSTTDRTPALQGSGSVGIRSYLGSGTTNGPIVSTVDDLAATAPATTPAPVNAAPTAAFTATPSGQVVTFDATASADPDGTVAGYAWVFGDGTTGSGRAPSHTYAPGTWTVVLTVTDDRGATGTATRSVVVAAPDLPPTARFTASTAGLALRVDGSGSTDPEGPIGSYAWAFGDGGTATGATAAHTYAAGGTYTVTLVVTDARGATGTSRQQVAVASADAPPVPLLLEQSDGLSAAFWGDRSSDPDGTVVAWAWAFGDGTTATGAAPTHRYAAAGTYTVTLTVTDDAGVTATTTRPVAVYAAGVRPTQAQWLADVDAALDGGTAYLDAHSSVARPAIVLDIDNTSLQSYYGSFAATPAVLALEQRAIADGYTVLFATGRDADTGGSRFQLGQAGYRVDALCFLDPAAASIQASKTACRAGWVAQGYTIVADVGNHTTDLDGGNAGRPFLLPNYGFLD